MITYTGNNYQRRAVCTLGTESAPVDNDVDSGIEIQGLMRLTIHAEAAQPFPAGAALLGYRYNPRSGKWNQDTSLIFDLTPGLTSQSFPSLDVMNRQGRLALIPNSAVPMTIDMLGTRYA